MKKAKMISSGLLVLMLLTGLVVLPAGATETVQVVPNVQNGSFEHVTFSSGEESVLEAIEGWNFDANESRLTASIVKRGDAGYAESPDGGNYVMIQRTGSSGNSVELYTDITNLQAETTYELSMYVKCAHNGAWLRFDYMNEAGGWLTKQDTYNSNIYFEKNYGSRYYNIRGQEKWAIVKLNFTLPQGGGGIRLNLGLNEGTAAYYDGISIKKATNLINWGECNSQWGNEEFKQVMLRLEPSSWLSDGSYCGYEYWFTTEGGTIKAPTAGFEGGAGNITATATLEQFVPVKDKQIYKLKFDGKGYGVDSTLTLNLTFAEDAEYKFTPFVVNLAKDKMATYETYIYVNGNFKNGEIPQSFTEARFIFSANGASRIDNVSLTEVDPITLSAKISGADAEQLEEGVNTVDASATIFKAAMGGTDDAMLVAAVYEGIRLTALELKPLAVGTADFKTDSVSVTATKGTHTVKLFLWDGVSGLRPIEDSIELR